MTPGGSKPVFTRIAVNVPRVQGVFDYQLSEKDLPGHALGQLVTVPFGAQQVQGIIIDYPEIPAVPRTKFVIKILDTRPVVTPQQIELAQEISRQTLAPLGVTLHAMIPAGLSVRSDVEYHLNESSLNALEERVPPPPDLSPAQQRLIELLSEKGPLRGRQLDYYLAHKNWRSTAGGLERRGLISSHPTLEDPSVGPKLERRVLFGGDPGQAVESMDTLARKNFPQALARRQAVLRMLLDSNQEIPVAEIYQQTGANLNDLQQLKKQGWLEIREVPVLRDPLEGLEVAASLPPRLTLDQETVWQEISRAFHEERPRPFLLHGVTGSGKTEIYLRAVEETLREGNQAIILVPEIALTPQTVSRFMSRFPGQVGVLHSQLSAGERYDTWCLARAGRLSVMVGPRSALFTPFPGVGLIVVDECHDDSYYQGDIDPHYHAVSSAAAYAAITGAVCIMGSATPDVVEAFESQRGTWRYLSLPERILAHKDSIRSQLSQMDLPPEESCYHDLDGELQTTSLPEVEVVDMRSELRQGNRSIFSRALQESLYSTLEKGQQGILFLNRRGSATYVFCRDCGQGLRCPRCETPLTYHAAENTLRCHHCGYQRQLPRQCPSCGSDHIRQLGTGTEQVEGALKKLLPGVRAIRWDRDTTRTKGAHWQIMEDFSAHRADILIGTQMLAKGLDLPLVTLVGVVLADSGLYLPDYRAPERTFQLLTQVAGRAGRSPLGGRVILQTYDPEHYVIRAAAHHDYWDFYQQELEYRRELGYPPYTRLVRLEVRSPEASSAESEAKTYAGVLKGWIVSEGYRATRLVGPVPAYYQKIRGEYRWQILLKGPDPVSLLRDHPPGGDWAIEVDPPTIL
jgi:primosomal protein N' (replication factor Y)